MAWVEVLDRGTALHEQSSPAVEDEDEGRSVRQVLAPDTMPRQLGDRTVLRIDNGDDLLGGTHAGGVQSNVNCSKGRRRRRVE